MEESWRGWTTAACIVAEGYSCWRVLEWPERGVLEFARVLKWPERGVLEFAGVLELPERGVCCSVE